MTGQEGSFRAPRQHANAVRSAVAPARCRAPARYSRAEPPAGSVRGCEQGLKRPGLVPPQRT